jgi:signal peptidase I
MSGPTPGGPQAPPAPAGPRRRRTTRGRATAWSVLLAVVLAVAVVRPLAVETFRIRSASMVPVLQPGDHVAVDRLAYRAGHIGHVFVLGDNRADSVDSRFSGPVPTSLVRGRVALRLWPLHRAATLD